MAPARRLRVNDAAGAAATAAQGVNASDAASTRVAAALMLFGTAAAAAASGAGTPSVGIIGGADTSYYDGYVVNPAALDATLHLAGTCVAAAHEAKTNTTVLRIPAAIAAFAATGTPTRPPMCAAAQCGPDTNHGRVPMMRRSASVYRYTGIHDERTVRLK